MLCEGGFREFAKPALRGTNGTEMRDRRGDTPIWPMLRLGSQTQRILLCSFSHHRRNPLRQHLYQFFVAPLHHHPKQRLGA